MSLPILLVLLLAGAPAGKTSGKARKPPPAPVATPLAPAPVSPPPPAVPLEPAPAASVTRSAPRPAPPAHRLGLSAMAGPGFSLVGGPITWRVTVRAEFLAAQVNARLSVFLLGPVGFGYWSLTTGFGGISFTTSSTSLEFTPTLRLQVRIVPVLSVYGDLGVGLVWASTITAARFVGYSEFSNFGLQFRTGVGARLELSERFSLFLEPLGLDYTLMGTSTTVVNGFPVVSGGGQASRYSIIFGGTFRL